jgi:sterol 24-C-methyltransferase
MRDIRAEVREYRRFHADSSDATREMRVNDYRKMVNELYFNFATNLYEFAWGPSFHFAPRRRHESFRGSLERLERDVARALGVGDEVLDVGCGVGGPMLEIARTCGANITGINLSEIQIERGLRHVRRAGLEHRCRFIHGDYMHIPVDDESFNAVYTLCAVPHAPDKRAVYREMARTLRTGSILAGTDWCMTSRFDPDFALHQDIKRRIQLGSALPDIDTIAELRSHLDEQFEVLKFRDIALDCDPETPWYMTLTSRERSLRALAATPMGRTLTRSFVGALELARLVPRGMGEVARFLGEGADGLVEGARIGIFTVVYYVARKIRRAGAR